MKEGIDKKNVASPNDRRHPMADKNVPAKEQGFGGDHGREAQVSVRRKSLAVIGRFHGRSIIAIA